MASRRNGITVGPGSDSDNRASGASDDDEHGRTRYMRRGVYVLQRLTRHSQLYPECSQGRHGFAGDDARGIAQPNARPWNLFERRRISANEWHGCGHGRVCWQCSLSAVLQFLTFIQ